MYEADLANMTRRRLLESLVALQIEHRRISWSVEDAQLMAEIRTALAKRGPTRRSPAQALIDTDPEQIAPDS